MIYNFSILLLKIIKNKHSRPRKPPIIKKPYDATIIETCIINQYELRTGTTLVIVGSRLLMNAKRSSNEDTKVVVANVKEDLLLKITPQHSSPNRVNHRFISISPWCMIRNNPSSS